MIIDRQTPDSAAAQIIRGLPRRFEKSQSELSKADARCDLDSSSAPWAKLRLGLLEKLGAGKPMLDKLTTTELLIDFAAPGQASILLQELRYASSRRLDYAMLRRDRLPTLNSTINKVRVEAKCFRGSLGPHIRNMSYIPTAE